MKHIEGWFLSGCLRKLDLSFCELADGDIRSAAGWELPNLKELNLATNKFVQLNFSLLRLPRLKWLNVSHCILLVQLLELPSTIAVVIADECWSLESFGDTSNCKWLWKLSLLGKNKLGPLGGDILLNSMLQGNAKAYFISFGLSGIDIWRGASALWVDWEKTYNMLLPPDWYNHFSGILMFFQNNMKFACVPNITIKLGVHENFQCELAQESNETVLKSHNNQTHVGYVSFISLRHTGCLNSTYNTISFSLCNQCLYGDDECWFRAVLVPKGDPMQTTKIATDSSEFWDDDRNTFIVKLDSNSSVKILWKP